MFTIPIAVLEELLKQVQEMKIYMMLCFIILLFIVGVYVLTSAQKRNEDDIDK